MSWAELIRRPIAELSPIRRIRVVVDPLPRVSVVAVRRWARSEGIDCPVLGPVPFPVLVAYLNAHPIPAPDGDRATQPEEQ